MTSPSERPTARRDDPRMRTVEMAALRMDDDTEADTLTSGPTHAPLPTLKVALLVAAGGALGALLRYLLGVAMPSLATPTLVELPEATLLANTLGCLGLGALAGVLEVRPGRPWMQPLLGTGLCGGFTTMSAAVLDGAAMMGADFAILAIVYASLSLLLSIGALVAGLLLARRLARPDQEERA